MTVGYREGASVHFGGGVLQVLFAPPHAPIIDRLTTKTKPPHDVIDRNTERIPRFLGRSVTGCEPQRDDRYKESSSRRRTGWPGEREAVVSAGSLRNCVYVEFSGEFRRVSRLMEQVLGSSGA